MQIFNHGFTNSQKRRTASASTAPRTMPRIWAAAWWAQLTGLGKARLSHSNCHWTEIKYRR